MCMVFYIFPETRMVGSLILPLIILTYDCVKQSSHCLLIASVSPQDRQNPASQKQLPLWIPSLFFLLSVPPPRPENKYCNLNLPSVRSSSWFVLWQFSLLRALLEQLSGWRTPCIQRQASAKRNTMSKGILQRLWGESKGPWIPIFRNPRSVS